MQWLVQSLLWSGFLCYQPVIWPWVMKIKWDHECVSILETPKFNKSVRFSYPSRSLNYRKTEGLDQKSNHTSCDSKGHAVLETQDISSLILKSDAVPDEPLCVQSANRARTAAWQPPCVLNPLSGQMQVYIPASWFLLGCCSLSVALSLRRSLLECTQHWGCSPSASHREQLFQEVSAIISGWHWFYAARKGRNGSASPLQQKKHFNPGWFGYLTLVLSLLAMETMRQIEEWDLLQLFPRNGVTLHCQGSSMF